MRITALLGLCVLLTACTAPEVKLENRAFTPKSPESTTQSTVSGLLESSMPLYLWNEAQGRYEIHRVDLSTGQDVPTYAPFVVGENEFIGPNILSPNGQKLAIVAANGKYCYPSGGGTACIGRADVLHIIDQADWQEVTTSLPGKGWAGPIAFSPDGLQLALTFNDSTSSTVMLFDTNTGHLIAQHPIAFQPSLMDYALDGEALMLYGQPLGSNPGMSKPDPPRLVLMDARSLAVKWEQELSNIVSGYWCLEKCEESHGEQTFADWMPAVVLSPDRNRLYIVHADGEQLTTVDFKTRTIGTTEIQRVQSIFERILTFTAQTAYAKGNFNGALKAGVLSPDGTRLYMVGQTMHTRLDQNGKPQETEESLGVEVIDIARSQKFAGIDIDATWVKITPDGVHLILGNWGEGQIDVLDANNLKSVVHLPKWEIVTTHSMNGRPIILGSQSSQALTQLAVFDARSFNVIHSWSLRTSYAAWLSTP